ncbi:MAG: ribosome maturation factor RimM [Deltaproteobacteria bacterium]|nr:ribosome maturation factor RimM [Deltaproteobacteria bacterium]
MNLLEAGRIIKPYGFKGCMKVFSYLESNDVLQSLDEVFIGKGTQVESFRLKGILIRGKFFFLEIEGIKDLEGVKSLVGCDVMIPADKLKDLAENEYYWRDIIGLDVMTEDGHFLGKIETIFPTRGNDVYVCTGGEREILLPAIADVIQNIDLEQRRVVVRLLEGL